MKKIIDIPKIERPREKLLTKGPQALSDVELLAILLGSGIKGLDVMKLANRILKVVDEDKEHKSIASKLVEIEGIGPAKAAIITAALEFARRRIHPDGVKITFPADILPLIQNYADRRQEHFICISLNGSNEIIATRVVTIGLLNRSQVHPREVFADPIVDRAAAIIVAHNHPSSSVDPSKEDIQVTNMLKKAGETLGIQLLDHIIFNKKDYYSFLENGEL